MKTRSSVLRIGYVLLAALAFFPVPAEAVFAQRNQVLQAPTAAMAGFMTIFFIFIFAVYIYISLALQIIAQKTNTANAWLAWIPIVNLFLMLNIAKKPLWWFVLFLIPFVNIIMAVLTWMGVAQARNKPDWIGILMVVPLANLIVPGYLAWSD